MFVSNTHRPSSTYTYGSINNKNNLEKDEEQNVTYKIVEINA